MICVSRRNLQSPLPRVRKVATNILAALSVLALVTPTAAQELSDISQRAERIQNQAAQRLATATSVALISPFYCFVDSVESDVFITNVFSESIDLTISAFNPEGQRLSLGSYTVNPTRHLQVSLGEALAEADSSFEAGSLMVEFDGDLLMLEAWLVMSSGETDGEQFIEWPFTKLGDTNSREISSFWDTRLLPSGTKPTFRLANSADHPVAYTLSVGRGTRTLFTERSEIAANSLTTLAPAGHIDDAPFGWIRIEHSEPGDVLSTVGWLSLGPPGQTPFLASLPIDVAEPTGSAAVYHSFEIPVGQEASQQSGSLDSIASPLASDPSSTVADRSVLSLHNTANHVQELEIAFLDFNDGSEIARWKRNIHPGRIASIDLAQRFQRLVGTRHDGRPVRAQLIGGDDALRLWAGRVARDGLVSDLTFLPTNDMNASGLYALPALATADVVNTMINIGDEVAHLRGQIFWEGGTYALPPIAIEPGSSHQLDIAAIAAASEKDLLDRSLDPNYTRGYLQWVTLGGNNSILDRLEVRRKGEITGDFFGFRYNSCCTRVSYPDLIPGNVTFPSGSSTSFLACEFINTCTSVLGPYNANVVGLNYSAPASWNGVTVSATAPTAQTASFDAVGTDFYCIESEQFIMSDSGDVDTCEEHNPNDYDPNEPCTQQGSSVTNCSQCCQCCKHLYRQQICECDGSAICKIQAESALGSCKVGCAEGFNCNSGNYCPGK